jgi:hypothetical protein
MGTFLTESVPVSLSGAIGNIGRFKLYACDQANVILYVAKQPVLTLDSNGKPGVAITTYTTQQPDRSVKIIGGAATIGMNTAPQIDQQSIDEAKALVASMGVGDPNRLKFLPLTTQKGKALLNLPEIAGAADKKHNDRDVGTPGALLSFLANLSEVGALEWSNAIKNRSNINGDITLQYEYLRRVPDVGAEVHVHGTRVFEHLSAALDVSYNGFFYGGSAKLEAAWDSLSRSGGIEVVFLGQGLPPELERLRQEMVATFTKQGMQILFDQIFAPMPQVAPAQANHGGGIFGGANFAMKWQKKTDAIDMTQRIEFRGTTWLTDTMDISLAALFSNLDSSVLTEVPAQQAFDSVITVDADPQLANAAVSMSYSAGHSPEAPLFTKEGGTQRYTVVSTAPSSVVVTCDTKINYAPPRWPVIPFRTVKTVGDGGNQMVVKTSSWVGRQMIHMYVREGNKIIPPSQLTADDYLVLNVSYAGPHLASAVRDSATLTPLAPVEFAYPLDPQGRPGEAKFSAFGIIGGEMKRAPEQVIPQNDSAVFILATRGGKIELVTSQTILNESDELAQSLRAAQGRPLFSGTVDKSAETTRKRAETKKASGTGAGKLINGRTIGVEYGSDGTSLWIRMPDGSSKRLRLHSVQDSTPFEKDSRQVKVQLDASGEYADSIFLDLVA